MENGNFEEELKISENKLTDWVADSLIEAIG